MMAGLLCERMSRKLGKKNWCPKSQNIPAQISKGLKIQLLHLLLAEPVADSPAFQEGLHLHRAPVPSPVYNIVLTEKSQTCNRLIKKTKTKQETTPCNVSLAAQPTMRNEGGTLKFVLA